MRTMETAFPSERVVELNGERYHLASRDQAEQMGARQWDWDYQSDQQEALPQPFTIPVASFHEGGGFRWADLPNVYEFAYGWDTITPGNTGTWAIHNTSDAVTVSAAPAVRGWLVFHGGFVYMCRGRYVTKFTVNLTPGATWAGTTSLDVETGLTGGASGDYICGRPVVWNSKLYVPVASSAGTPKRFGELTTIGTPDTWTTGPAARTAKAFQKWKNLLVRLNGTNGIASVATAPTTDANWSDYNSSPYIVGDPGRKNVDSVVWEQYLLTMREDGVFSLDEQLLPRLEVPDLAAVNDTRFGLGAAVSHGEVMIPTMMGLARLMPGRGWRLIGPDQEGQFNTVSQALGRPIDVVANGPSFYVCYQDPASQGGSLWTFMPAMGGRQPYIPHCFIRVGGGANDQEVGMFEGLCVITPSATNPRQYLCAIKTNAAGTSASIYTWMLPAYGAHAPAMDWAAVTRYGSYRKSLFSSRYYGPSRGVPKLYRSLDLFLQVLPLGSNVPGLQVWASVDDGTAVQLLTAAGAAATLKNTESAGQIHRLFFPKNTTGKWLRLEFRVPATGGGESDMGVYQLADIVIRGSLLPRQEPLVSAVLVLGEGGFEDRTRMRRTPQQQMLDIQGLLEAGAVPYKGPRGETGYVTVPVVKFRDVRDRESDAPVKLAILGMRMESYE